MARRLRFRSISSSNTPLTYKTLLGITGGIVMGLFLAFVKFHFIFYNKEKSFFNNIFTVNSGIFMIIFSIALGGLGYTVYLYLTNDPDEVV